MATSRQSKKPAPPKDLRELRASGVNLQDLLTRSENVHEVSCGAANGRSLPSSVIALNDSGNARRFVSLHGENLRFDHSSGTWYVWDGIYWRADLDGEVKRRARNVPSSLAKEAAEKPDSKEVDAFLKFARATGDKKRLDALIALAASNEAIALTQNELNADPMLLGTQNGFIELTTGEFHQPARNKLITKSVGCRYESKARAKIWDEFLATVFDHDCELISFLQRWCGYCLTADTREQKFLFLFGSGANGKSTFIETLKTLLGDYGQKAPESLFVLDPHGQGATATNDLARLPGVRVCIGSELADGRWLNESRIKDLTGGDSITARFLRREFFDFHPTRKLIIYGNHQPQIRGTDHGMWRRVLMVPFKVTIADKDKDPTLALKLCQELPGILNWCIEGCLAWQRHGLNPPASVLAAVECYREEQDIVGRFLTEKCETHPARKIEKAILFEAFRQFSNHEFGSFEITSNRFTRELKARGFREGQRSSHQRFWEGLTLSPRTPQ